MKRVLMMLAVVMSGAYGGAALGASVGEQLADCRKETTENLRLACYDLIGSETNSASSPVDPTDTGMWDIDISSDPITDQKIVSAMASAVEGKGVTGKAPIVAAVCVKGRVNFVVDWQDLFFGDLTVTHRVDEAAPASQKWQNTGNNRVSMHPKPGPFIKSILDKNRLVLRYLSEQGKSGTAIFDISGLRAALAPHPKVCPI